MSRESGGNLAVGVVAGGMTPRSVAEAMIDEMVSRDSDRAGAWLDVVEARDEDRFQLLADKINGIPPFVDPVWESQDGYFSPNTEEFDDDGPPCLVGDHNYSQYHAWILFSGQPETLDTAAIRVRLIATRYDGEPTPSGNDVLLTVKAVAAASPSAPTSYAEAAALTLTTASVAWTIDGATYAGTDQFVSPNLDALIDEIAGAGWTPGNDVIFVIVPADGNGGFANFEQDMFRLKWIPIAA